ncbi:hypothetical protein HK100_001764 [Physocladia obscura]|uniref:Uncharacterized protein n=1 Tax=Physocladia obscura TaxID=109957 RepID=A0AAD5SWA7_9FUNG|nr:hypothetical protein HK100_001764 [Physocladia obscura]
MNSDADTDSPDSIRNRSCNATHDRTTLLASVNEGSESLLPLVDGTTDLLSLLAHPDISSITLARIELMLSLIVDCKHNFAIPNDVIFLAARILEVMDELKISADAWTLSFKILVASSKSDVIYNLWTEYKSFITTYPKQFKRRNNSYHQASLQPWAYNIAIYSLAEPWRNAELVYNPHLTASKPFTHQLTQKTKQLPTYIPNTSLIWSVYSHMKEMGVEPTQKTNTITMQAMLAARPMNFKAIRKARKLIFGNQRNSWRTSTYEAIFDGIAQCGTVEELNKTLHASEQTRFKLNRPIADAIMKFYSFNNSPEKVLEFHNSSTHLTPTHVTFTCLLTAMATATPLVASESSKLINELCSTSLLNLLKSGNETVGPATFDLLIATVAKIKDFDAVQRYFKILTTELIPLWKENGIYNFSSLSDETEPVVLGPLILKAMMASFGAQKDSMQARAFFDKWMIRKEVLKSCGGSFKQILMAFAMEWTELDSGSEDEINRVLFDLKSLESQLTEETEQQE